MAIKSPPTSSIFTTEFRLQNRFTIWQLHESYLRADLNRLALHQEADSAFEHFTIFSQKTTTYLSVSGCFLYYPRADSNR